MQIVNFSLFYLILISSCVSSGHEKATTSNDLLMEQQIEKTLNAKYKEDFKVTEQFFDKSLNLYLFKAHPANNKEIIFEGNFDEREADIKDKIDQDSYVNTNFSFQATQFFESTFPNKELKYKISSSIYSYYDHKFGNSLPSFDEWLEERPEKSTIRMNCYFFDIPDEPYHQLVITLQAVIEMLHEKFDNNYSVYTGFWPSGFLEDKDFKNMTVGFESTSMDDADNLLNVMQYLSKVFFVKVVNSSIEKLDDEGVYNLIKDHNKKGPNAMVEI